MRESKKETADRTAWGGLKISSDFLFDKIVQDL